MINGDHGDLDLEIEQPEEYRFVFDGDLPNTEIKQTTEALPPENKILIYNAIINSITTSDRIHIFKKLLKCA